MNVSNRLMGIIILYLVTAFICIGFLTKKIENIETAEQCYQLAMNSEAKVETELTQALYVKALKLQPMNEKYVSKVRKVKGRYTDLNKKAKTLIKEGRQKEAIKYCQEKIEELKDSPLLIEKMVAATLHNKLARIYEEAGQEDIAQEHREISQNMKKEVPRYRGRLMSLIVFPIGVSAMSVVSIGLLIMVLGIVLGITRLTEKGKKRLSIESKFRPKEIVLVVILSILPFFVFLFPFFPKYGTVWAIGFPFPLWLLIISPLVYFLKRRKGKGIFPFLKELLFLSFIILPFWIVVFMFYSTIGVPIVYSWLKYY